MGLFSFLRKKNQESAGDSDGAFQSRAETGAGRGKRKRAAADNEAADPVLPEKKRARRRLVGAIALVLAAIIGLPMILDSEPKPLAEDIAIQIPARDKPAATGAIRPAPPASAAPVSAPKTSAAAGLDKGEEVIDPAARKAPAAVAAALPVKPATPESRQAAKVEPKPEPKAETKVAAIKPAEKSNAKPDDAARALAILDGKPEAKAEAKPVKAADKKPSKYIVQVAALGSQDKVKELQNKLKGAGIQSYTQKVPTESGERIRVRVGPFGSKEEAEKTRAKLVKLGLNGTLVPA